MSYCRWSSDDFKCDLYCYEDVSGGFTTHVAGRRRVIPDDALPAPLPWPAKDCTEEERKIWSTKYLERHMAVSKMLDDFPLVPIGLPHDGESFNDPDLESFRDRVKSLKAMGYCVPDGVIESIEDEIKEEKHG